ncbi:TetR/AcrR family transcriptional regulator [Bosea sp. F3-2]|uniref:TetR/AcrR family transcriptional regulator n=1 Tax=Bosea sp. F3-2 TaxID=2599640 RepID=UPI0020C0B6DC|nr:TetR/AcrR family transcriptional regulator [Bosea sp. F3-2]
MSAAVAVFREHGYEGTSARMLVDAMGIGRQSIYDTFGDKWGLYRAALAQYSENETRAHRDMLASCDRGIDGIRAMLDRVVSQASLGCLGIGSIVEFGCSQPDLVEIRETFGRYLNEAVVEALIKAKAQGDVGTGLGISQLATFLLSAIASMRIAARSGASREHVAAIAELTIRALK